MRLTHDDYPVLASSFRFDDLGNMIDRLTVEELRTVLERSWTATSA
jgi:hypothetical protein